VKLPWHDAPRCSCGGPMVTTDLRPRSDERLRCCACGTHVRGNDEEVARAELADDAWDRHRASWKVLP
jgi:hypothetical protein